MGALLVAGSFLKLTAFLGTTPLATLGGVADAEAGAEGALLIHIFRPDDCPRFRSLVRKWNELHRVGGLPVLGIGLDLPKDSSRRAKVVRESGAAFPVRPDVGGRAERLVLRLGHERTPLAVLVDGLGRPRLVLPPLAGPEGPRRAARLVVETATALGRRSRSFGGAPGEREP